MARKYTVKQPKNQRPMINNAYTAEVKRKMSYAIVPFIIGAIVLVFSMGQAIEDKTLRLVCLIVGVVLFLFGVLFFIKYAKDLNDYSKAYWEKVDEKEGKTVKQDNAPREKVTWAQAKAEYQAEAKEAALEATKKMAEKFIQSEQDEATKKE